MEHKTRIGGWEIHLEQNAGGLRFQIHSNPDYEVARQQVFQQLDQLRDSARQVGVTGIELVGHILKARLDKKGA